MKSKDPPRFDAVVLAAGAGRRFGQAGKLLAPWGDTDVLGAAIEAARKAPIRTLILVTGSDPDIGEGRPGVSLVAEAQGWESGMAASLRTGLESVPPDSEGVFIFLGDMPRVPAEIFAPMAEAVHHGAPAAAPVFEGRRGNPVLIAARLFHHLLRLEGDQGARTLLDSLGPKLALVPAPDDGVLFDIDTPEDLAAADRGA